uniref:Uncharacterized protein n=1 Tax=Amphimedon queenslandica TaxID=400682 RepID=A0A1X7UIU4_AMPQE
MMEDLLSTLAFVSLHLTLRCNSVLMRGVKFTSSNILQLTEKHQQNQQPRVQVERMLIWVTLRKWKGLTYRRYRRKSHY